MNTREALGTMSGAGQALSVCYLFGLWYNTEVNTRCRGTKNAIILTSCPFIVLNFEVFEGFAHSKNFVYKKKSDSTKRY